jgi:aldose sugar dehydrogenase
MADRIRTGFHIGAFSIWLCPISVWLFAWLAPVFADSASDVVEMDTERARIRVVTVASGLDQPWGLAFLPDGRLLVTERPGRLRIIAGNVLSAPLAGVPEVLTVDQGGLLDVAIDPEFKANRLIYLSLSEPAASGSSRTAVIRARFAETSIEDVQVIFRQQPAVATPAHFGSRLAFGRDGRLFVTLGERQAPENSARAQHLDTHFGKVVRIESDGRVPGDNPFGTRPGARPEVWSYGHRNPQGAAIHPQTGELWITEHGPRGGDELNVAHAGQNYGWPRVTYGVAYSGKKIGEGTEAPGTVQPLHYWKPSIGTSGLAFYTSQQIPGWRGSAFVGGLVSRSLSRLEMEGQRIVHEERLLESLGERIRDVRQGPDGFLYVLADRHKFRQPGSPPLGRVLRIEPVAEGIIERAARN